MIYGVSHATRLCDTHLRPLHTHGIPPSRWNEETPLPDASNQTAPKRELSLFDSTCIIVGIIIGAGLYEMAPAIAREMGSGIGAMGIWVAGAKLPK